MQKNIQQNISVPGMGAIVHQQGVFFRVWAPNAKRVFVMGDFNAWREDELELKLEDNGYYGINVAQARAGSQYKYVIISKADEKLIKNDPYARELTNSNGNSVVYDSERFDWEDDQSFMPYWNEAVIYELHLGTFYTKEKNQPGNFYTLKEKIPYLKDLGINVIEIMPPFEFPGAYSWGYNPAYPFAIESDYGGPDALKALVKEAHNHGIAVILDAVYNHFGPSDIDLWRFDGWYENDKGGIYFYNDWKSATPWGDTRPDYGRPEVRNYIKDNARMWLTDFHIDGLRLDSTYYMRHVEEGQDMAQGIAEAVTLLKEINAEVQEKYPQKLIIAEDLHNLEVITNSLDDGGVGFSSQWDSVFVHTIRNVLITQEDEQRDMEQVAKALTQRYSNGAFKRVIYTESHDEVGNGTARVAEEIAFDDVNNWYSKKRATLGIALVMTAPGIPMIFQGQELLEDKWFSDTDPIDWSLLEQHKGIFQLHKDLIALRLNKQDFTRGLCGQHIQIIRADQEQKVVAYQRWKEGGERDTTVVVLNFSVTEKAVYRIGFPAPGLWRIRFNSDWDGYDADFSNYQSFDVEATGQACDGFEHSAEVSIAPYTALVFSQG